MRPSRWSTIWPPLIMTSMTLACMAVGYSLFALSDGRSAPRRNFVRTTLTVETPEGLRIGASVDEQTVTFDDGLNSNALSVIRFDIRGPPTVVDLGSRGLLLCMLEEDWARPGSAIGPSGLVDEVFSPAGDPRRFDDLNVTKPDGDVPVSKLPLLVRFQNVAGSQRIDVVDPRDLAKSFGPGVRLARAVVAITDGPITPEIESKAPEGWRSWSIALKMFDQRILNP